MRMNPVMTKNFTGWLESRTFNRMLLWVVLSLTLSIYFFQDFWASLPVILSPDWVLGQYNVSPWAVLALCLVFLLVKRKEVWQEMSENKRFLSLRAALARYIFNVQLPLGIAVVAGAILMPSSQDYVVFQVLLASLGVFIIIFGRAARIPSILLTIYGFAISFPLAVERFAEDAYARTAITPMMAIMTALGYPLRNEGQWVNLTSSGGESISVIITAACAGPATIGVFIALFVLMMLDMPLPPKKTIWLFIFGAVGTWFQSFVRLIFLMLVSYHLGEAALWTAHRLTIYIVFPLWYFLFAYVYFRQVRRPLQARGKQKLEYAPIGGI